MKQTIKLFRLDLQEDFRAANGEYILCKEFFNILFPSFKDCKRVLIEISDTKPKEHGFKKITFQNFSGEIVIRFNRKRYEEGVYEELEKLLDGYARQGEISEIWVKPSVAPDEI